MSFHFCVPVGVIKMQYKIGDWSQISMIVTLDDKVTLFESCITHVTIERSLITVFYCMLP